MLERRKRPTRGEIDEAALTLLSRHGAQILALARRYTASGDDAEDAYQRAIEILLTKAPTTREEELVPWLKTVVKHEAFALRRQRERLTPVTSDGEPVERGTAPTATHEQAERYERLRQGAEALRRLKPQEIRCLVLRAQGLSYREICEVTGFTYTKVNRCLTEGRQALAVRMAGIENGVECERMAPLLSALADGEADAAALAALRPHLRTCLACRARLREFRAAPARVAALVPAAAVVGGGHAGGRVGAGHAPAEGGGAARRGSPQDGRALRARPGRRRADHGPEGRRAGGERRGAGRRRHRSSTSLANHRGPPLRTAAAQAEPAPQPDGGAERVSAAGARAATPPATESPSPAEQAAAPEPAPPPPPPDPATEFAPASDAAPSDAADAAVGTAAAPPAREAPAASAPSGARGGAREFAP